ncbi:MAG TPA: Rnf-Nqr domain containing protein [Terriglobales bacterium]|nr:Rnf-Nqr domain containing protein [Terriglobales bacterium]
MVPSRARVLVLVALLLLAPALAAAATPRILSARVVAPSELRLRFSGALPRADAENFRLTTAREPDIPIAVQQVRPAPGNRFVLTFAQRLMPAEHYHLELVSPPIRREVQPSPWALLLTVMIAAAFINNFVFTRYLGLCIFFGVSKRRDTAIGMGITFTLVMIATAMLSWALDRYVLGPLRLGFLQILVFIGVVAFVVQFLDTMLRKTHPVLHRRFGIYLMLITTNCIILAVPLLNAQAGSGPLEALALAIGSGAGFALALFLMSCARERMEYARVPLPFQGLPIAFALAGLFALAFMGFSGLDFFR